MKKQLFFLGLTLLILLCVACSPRVQVDHPTATATNTPDTQATETQIALLVQQTTQAEEAAAALATQAAETTATRAVELTSVAEAAATQEAISEQQATLAAGQATLEAEQVNVANTQGEFLAASTEAAAYAVTLQAESAVLATVSGELAAGQQALASEQAALADAQTAFAVTQAAAIELTEVQQTAETANIEVASTLTTEWLTLAPLVQTATAAAATDVPILPTDTAWREVVISQWGLIMDIPPELADPAYFDGSAYFEEANTDREPPASIALSWARIVDLTANGEFSLADLSDAVSMLTVGLRQPLEENIFTIIEDVQVDPRLPYEGASVLVNAVEFNTPIYLGVVRLSQNQWLTISIYGTQEQLDAWIDPFLQNLQIDPLEAPIPAEITTTPAIHPTSETTTGSKPAEEPTAEPTEEAALPPQRLNTTLGLDFAMPEGWTLEPGDAHNIRLVAPVDISQEIALSRGMAEEFDLPADLSDPMEALRIIAETINEELAFESRIRVNTVEIANLPGAVTTLRNDDLTMRLYLIPIEEEWLLIMANAPRADFNSFNRNELRDFFASLKLANTAD